ncbi:hypothetical protein HNP87_001407 [Methanococcus maripaludis]|uniref:Apea-like HEPN domain-containing protein n=1 Tax=Methanococcus maripaludis TaxID=39152 RepID=A0A7J9NIY1_METMI|nr:HEPN domain-containing protein [Methanococcus maripaludis]MBA2840875.1 hypothetical protein [Methanococcus maripaludis]
MKNFDKLSVEYLIFISGQENFCDTENAFNSLLMTNSKVKIKKNKYSFDNFEVNYNIELNPVENNIERVFNVLFECDDKKDADKFSELISSFENILGNLDTKGVKFGKIWDELSLYYGIMAYPEINYVENLMRKLITKFMAKFGTEWTEKYVPDKVVESLRCETDDLDENEETQKNFGIYSLYEIDFIRLEDFLFRKYPTAKEDEVKKIVKNIEKADKIEQLSLKDLKEAYVYKSNWERFFSNEIGCTQNKIKIPWRKLYKLRCMVAHNNTVNKEDYENITQLVKDLKVILNKALKKIGDIEINPEIKDSVMENTYLGEEFLKGKFINKYIELNNFLNEHFNDVIAGNTKTGHTLTVARILYLNKYIDVEIYFKIKDIQNFRNGVVYGMVSYTTDDLKQYINTIDYLITNFTKNPDFGRNEESNFS